METEICSYQKWRRKYGVLCGRDRKEGKVNGIAYCRNLKVRIEEGKRDDRTRPMEGRVLLPKEDEERERMEQGSCNTTTSTPDNGSGAKRKGKIRELGKVQGLARNVQEASGEGRKVFGKSKLRETGDRLGNWRRKHDSVPHRSMNPRRTRWSRRIGNTLGNRGDVDDDHRGKSV